MCGSVQTTVWKKTCIILAWKTHVRIGWKYSKTCDEGTPLYPGQSIPTWQVPSSQVCHMHDGSAAVLSQSHATYNCMQLEESLMVWWDCTHLMIFYSCPTKTWLASLATKYLVDHDNILILSPNDTWLASYPHKSTFKNYYIIAYLEKC